MDTFFFEVAQFLDFFDTQEQLQATIERPLTMTTNTIECLDQQKYMREDDQRRG